MQPPLLPATAAAAIFHNFENNIRAKPRIVIK